MERGFHCTNSVDKKLCLLYNKTISVITSWRQYGRAPSTVMSKLAAEGIMTVPQGVKAIVYMRPMMV